LPGRTWVTGPFVDLELYGDDPAIKHERLVGIIDTGASCICVDARVVKRLGLVASDRVPMEMADGRTEISTVYTARMIIRDLEFDDYVRVHAVEMGRPSARVLIGRSFLKAYIVNYDGPRERFEFHQSPDWSEFYFPDHDE
jgi:predicted aspartyl protease